MTQDDVSDLNLDDYEKYIDRCSKQQEVASKLARCDVGTGHDNFLNGIIVQFDIKYPQYFSMQMQRYHFLDFISSQSKMHTITKRQYIDNNCNKWVDKEVIELVNRYIHWYNNFEKEIQRLKDKAWSSGANTLFGEVFEMEMVEKICLSDKYGEKHFYNKEELFMKILSNLPMGFELWAGVTTNLRQLKTIHRQRRNHRLPEWQYFCDWIENLGSFKELILEND
jgi:hypothetical protein